ncbi:hypothetical protein SK141_0385 [Streptococcus oralis]|nr:hypothetical protein SK141_0385 [Streptococcus oralis]
MVPSNPLKKKFQATLLLKNRLHDFLEKLGYLLLLSCVILDRLQRNQYFSFVEKKQHGISFL